MSAIIQVAKSQYGGAGIYAARLNDALRNKGHSSCLVTSDNGGLAPTEGLQASVRKTVDRFISSGFQRMASVPFHSAHRFKKWEIPLQPDSDCLIHLHSVNGLFGYQSLLDFVAERVPVFWTAHNHWLFTGGCISYAGCDRYMENCEGCPVLRKPVSQLAARELQIKRKLLRQLKVVPIANSKWMAAMMQKSPIFNYQENVPVVPPIISNIFLPPADKGKLRALVNVSEDQLVVCLSANSLTDPGKSIYEFFNSLPKQEKWLRKVTFLLIGDGDVKVPTGIEVRKVGRITSPKRLAELYGISDLYVSPSAMETYGMAILEAQACGTPVVAFSTGGTPEAVYPDLPCRLVANHDFNALHKAVRDLVEGECACSSPMIELSEWVVGRHSASIIADKQTVIYDRHSQERA